MVQSGTYHYMVDYSGESAVNYRMAFQRQVHYDMPMPLRYCDSKDHFGSSIDNLYYSSVT